MVTYKQGDIIVMDFNPQKGHEQSARRLAIVLNNDILNQHSSTAIVCPITNTNKRHPFHIEFFLQKFEKVLAFYISIIYNHQCC